MNFDEYQYERAPLMVPCGLIFPFVAEPEECYSPASSSRSPLCLLARRPFNQERNFSAGTRVCRPYPAVEIASFRIHFCEDLERFIQTVNGVDPKGSSAFLFFLCKDDLPGKFTVRAVSYHDNPYTNIIIISQFPPLLEK